MDGLRTHQTGKDFAPERSAQCETGSVVEDDRVLPVEERLHFLDAFHVHDRGSMNADETASGELLLHLSDLLPDEELPPLDVEADVIPLRFDPVDLFRFQKRDPAGRLHLDPTSDLRLGTLAGISKRLRSRLLNGPAAPLQNPVFRTTQRVVESHAIERFHDVIEATRLKRLNSALIEGSYEHDNGGKTIGQLLEDLHSHDTGLCDVHAKQLGL